ncbi:TraG family conjugative transposon ATPase [Sphingobacterium suaedae]|uniref:TraG family conjugative transposon ATPase n=1 Tax=Sphingobacterium suaedae TaxID=1686402 RepID=A0ABW5KK35_9SPHI
MNPKKTTFEMPYIAIDSYQGMTLLYGDRGDFSSVIGLENPVLQYSADPRGYIAYQQVLLNVLKVLGEGHLIQKHDIFVRRTYSVKPTSEFLAKKYQQHFQGRAYTEIRSFLTITYKVKKGAFYTYDKKILSDFAKNMAKVFDLLEGAGLKPFFLSEKEVSELMNRLLTMDFVRPYIALNNIRCQEHQLETGNGAIRCVSLVNTDVVDLPGRVSPFASHSQAKAMGNFPVDNLFFFHNVPGFRTIVYSQVLEIPAQQSILSRLELKRKRHSGIPDPANQICVEDIDRLLEDVARDSQLLVNAHYTIAVFAARDQIEGTVNFIEAALFQQGIIPSRNAFNQLELFRGILPGNSVELKKYDWFLTTAPAALCLFFRERLPTDEPSDFLLRFTDRQGIPVAIDLSDLPMRTGRIKNRNRFVLGASGTGKSYCINSIVQQYLQYNMDVVIVDVGHSYSGLCSTYNGRYITYSEDTPITMNPFAITEEEYNIEKKEFLVTLICLLWKGAEGTVSTVERDVISSVLSAYYASFFDHSAVLQVEKLDFNSFYEFAIRTVPEIKKEEGIKFDVEEFRFVLKKFYRGGEYESILNEAADQSLFNERFIVYEIDNVQNNKVLLPIVTLIIMDLFIQKMRHRKNRRKALILEEAWRAISSPMMANFLLYLNKTVRKFWGEIIEVTQEINDIIGNPIIKDSIINNSDTVILLQQNEADFRKVAELLSIDEVEQKKIFTINQLENKEGRPRFNEFYIRRGNVGEVYGIEVSIFHHLAFTTEKPEKSAVEIYALRYGGYEAALTSFVSDLQTSGLPLSDFVQKVNQLGEPFS